MTQFPSIQQPVYPFTTKIKDPSLQAEMENGLVVSRPRFTRVPQSFVLKWTALPAADYAVLRDFYRSVYGGSQVFVWCYPSVANDPYSGKVFSVRFTGEEFSFNMVAPGYYAGTVTVQEV
ncbi:MAG: hypothetical protein E6X17_09820 [Sporomusaceae bacterium]|nr:hypothetical protein [Sporomusaceae bacterium]